MKATHHLPRATAVLALACTLLAACAQQPAAPNPSAAQELKAFPATLKGHQRHVIELPALPDEADRQIELIGTKAMTVDCNSRGMDGRFEARDVPGWGYSYWVLQSQGQVHSTMMMCPPGSAKPGFVQAEPLLVRYNSKLPVVVYTPADVQVRYRIWSAADSQAASPR